MKKVPIVLMVLLASCTEEASKEPVSVYEAPEKTPVASTNNKNKETTESHHNQDENVAEYSVEGNLLINDDFAGDPFGFEATAYSSLKKLKPSKLESRPHANIHMDGQIDTIYSFYFDSSTITVYKTHNRQLFLNALVRDSTVVLKEGIKIGMSKQAFLSKFEKLKKVGATYDTFKISVFDAAIGVEFKFADNKLVQYRYYDEFVSY